MAEGSGGGTEVHTGYDSPAAARATGTAPTEPVNAAGPQPGDCVGRFTLRGSIGRGGMGQVFAALDPYLDREVAVKIVFGTDSATRTRVMREGQALARLTHPNVVTIFDVGVHGDHVFLAMERVQGETLATWLLRSHRWREIRDMLVAAGRGLEAAHAAGVVHRDFKPQNVMVAKDRVVVLDFGLARAGSEPNDLEPEPHPTLGLEVTQTGARIGTPRYMAPEQHQGAPVTPRSDQFSFCVVLHEALTGTRLFHGDTSEEILAAMRRLALPKPAGVPRFLAAALARGLSYDPDARFPSMTALLRALARDPARQARRWLLAGFTAAALATGGYIVAGTRPLASPCGTGREPLGGLWDAGQREALRAHARSVDPVLGDERALAASAALDAYTGAWADMRASGCRATRVAGTQSDTLLDLRVRCLDRRLDEVRGTVGLLMRAGDPTALDSAGTAAGRLTPLDGCADAAALTAAIPLPEKPAERARAKTLEDEVLAIALARRSGALDGLAARARAAVATARELDYPPGLAAALKELAAVLHETGDGAAEIDVLEELTQVAAAARDDDTSVHAFAELEARIAFAGHTDQALGLFPAASAAVLRSGNGPLARVKLLVAEAQVLDAEAVHRPGDALPKLAEARRILEAEGAAVRGSPLLSRLADVEHEIGLAHIAAGDMAGAITTFRELIELYRSAFGRDHPAEAFAQHNLGQALRAHGKPEEALTAFNEAVRIRSARLGETMLLADSLVGVGNALHDLDRYQESLAPIEHADRIVREHLGPSDRARSMTLMSIGTTHLDLKHFDEARRAFDEVVALEDRPPKRSYLGVALLNRAEIAARTDRCEDALPDYRRAIEVFDATTGPKHFYLIYPLSGAGRCLVLLGRPAEALPLLERAIALSAPGMGKVEQAMAHFFHGRALVASGHQRGRAEARTARADLAAFGASAAELLAEADAWLASH